MEVCLLKVYLDIPLGKTPGGGSQGITANSSLGPFPQGALGLGWPLRVGLH